MVLLAATLFAIAARSVTAEELRLFPASSPGPLYFTAFDPGGEAGFRILDLEGSYPWTGVGGPSLGIEPEALPGAEDLQDAAPAPPEAPPRPPKKLFTTGTTLVTAGALAGGVLDGLLGPLHFGFKSFSFADEGWFERSAYAGGADKCSHFIAASGVARLLFEVYKLQGHSEDQSFALALATTIVTGALVEVGDGVTARSATEPDGGLLGFSAQDLAADALGTVAGLLINRNHLQDLLGLRLGRVPTSIPSEITDGYPSAQSERYSGEIYTADLRFGGLITRLRARPGIARYFLGSVVYFTKGFGYTPQLPTRYQETGFEVGLDIPEILTAAGVRETTWWGRGLLTVFSFFRIPFTQIGVYYNLTNHKWYGPAAPYHFYQ